MFTVLITAFLFWSTYRRIAGVFQWLTLVLLAYVATAFFSPGRWVCLCWQVRPRMLSRRLPHGGDRSTSSRRARPKFYGVLAVTMLLGCAIDFAGLDAVKMLFWSAVVNGALAPPLILLVVLLTRNPKVMGKRVSSPTMQASGWLTFALMSVATVGMLFP